MDAGLGVRARVASGLAFACRVAVPRAVTPWPRWTAPVTVCGPAVVAVQVLAVQEPSGLMVKVVYLVRSPSGLP